MTSNFPEEMPREDLDADVVKGAAAGCRSVHNSTARGEARNLDNKNYISQFCVQDIAADNAAILNPDEPHSFYIGARLKLEH